MFSQLTPSLSLLCFCCLVLVTVERLDEMVPLYGWQIPFDRVIEGDSAECAARGRCANIIAFGKASGNARNYDFGFFGHYSYPTKYYQFEFFMSVKNDSQSSVLLFIHVELSLYTFSPPFSIALFEYTRTFVILSYFASPFSWATFFLRFY